MIMPFHAVRPHCAACSRMKACCTGSGMPLARGPRPSSVTMFAPNPTQSFIGITQGARPAERGPSISRLSQGAPHSPSPAAVISVRFQFRERIVYARTRAMPVSGAGPTDHRYPAVTVRGSSAPASMPLSPPRCAANFLAKMLREDNRLLYKTCKAAPARRCPRLPRL